MGLKVTHCTAKYSGGGRKEYSESSGFLLFTPSPPDIFQLRTVAFGLPSALIVLLI